MRLLSAWSAAPLGIAVVASACSHGGGTSSPATVSSETAGQDLDETVSGKTPTDVAAAEQAISAALTAQEQAHLTSIDWSTATGASLIADTVFMKAFKAVELVPAASPNQLQLTQTDAPGIQALRRKPGWAFMRHGGGAWAA